MKEYRTFSDEQLNAFVDGELETEERALLLNESEQIENLDKQLCQQRKVKELVNLAYQDIPKPSKVRSRGNSQMNLFNKALAASILFVMGVGMGFVAHQQISKSDDIEQTANIKAQNYIVHVVSGEQEQMRKALQKVRLLLNNADNNQNIRVEVVANERGLNLLRSDVTPFADEIRALANNDVVFYACAKAIERLEEKGIDVNLLPEAHSDYTAIDRVVMRMQAGWKYQKI